MATFYAGQTDYIDKLNTLADAQAIANITSDLNNLSANVSAAQAAAQTASNAASQVNYADWNARYLGSKTSDPTVNNTGGALVVGNIYWNSVTSELRVYVATNQWVASQSVSSSVSAANSATLAQNWATQLVTPVSGGEYSAKYHAQAASTSATNAASYVTASSNNATLAQNWATQLVTPVSGGEYSAKYHAQAASASANTASTQASNASTSANTASTQASNASNSATLAQNWATQLVTPVSGGEYSAKYHAQAALASANTATNQASNASTSATLAQNWAIQLGTPVSGGEYSAKYNAQAASNSATNASNSATLAQNWATQLVSPVSGGEYSAKYWAQQAAASITGTLVYRGSWDASTGIYPPNLGTGSYYKVTVSGTVSGILYNVGDSILYNGTVWEKVGSIPTITGTANSIAYFNASQNLASTSALSFDGSNLGIGTTSPITTFDIGLNGNRTGGNIALGQKTPLAIKYTAISSTQYDYSAESEGFTLIASQSSTNAENSVRIGGYISELNAATNIIFYTAENANTRAGTERVRIDASGNLGINCIPDSKIRILGTNAGTGPASLRVGFNNTSTNYFDADTQYFRKGDGTDTLVINSSGNIGIGTSSPTVKLDVLGIANFYSGASGTFNFINIGRTATEARVGAVAVSNDFLTGTTVGDSVFYSASTTGNAWYGTAGSKAAIFTTNNTERMRLDSSGNLGLGVTPSSWHASGTLQGPSFSISQVAGVDQTAWVTGATQSTYLGSWLSRGGYRATMYQHQTGAHAWYTNNSTPTGPGQTISFTQAMTLDASGNLAVGTTSSSYRLRLVPSASDADVLRWENSGGTIFAVGGVNTTNSLAYVGTGTNHAFAFATNNTERARITSGGDLLVGTTSAPAYTSKMRLQGGLEIHGAQQHNVAPGNTNPYEFVNRSSGGFDFYPTGTTLGFRITGGGNLLLGTTTNYSRLTVSNGSSTRSGITISDTNTSSLMLFAGASADAVIAIDANNLVFKTGATVGQDNGTERVRIDSNGNLLIGTTSANYNAAGRGLIEVNGSTDSVVALKRNGGNSLYLQNFTTASYLLNTPNTPLIIGTNNVEQLRVTATGLAVTGNITQNGYQVLDSNNYSSYTVPTSGGSISGDIIANNAKIGQWTGNSTYRGLYHSAMTGNEYMIISGDADSNTYISARTGANVYIRGGGNVNNYELVVYPTSRPTVGGNTILDAGNYTSYSPDASRFTSAVSVSNFNSIKLPGLYHYDGTLTNTPNGRANYRSIEIGSAGRYSQIALPWDQDGMWIRRQTNADWSEWREILHSANYNSYSPTLTGTGATGTWSIGITGNANSSNYVNFIDNRAVNDQPQNKISRVLSADFKEVASVGSPPITSTSSLYAHVLTVAGWSSNESSGGWPTQLSIGNGIAWRQATSATAWGSWNRTLAATSDTATNLTLSGTVDQTGSVRGGVTAVAASNIDCSLGNYFTKTISGATTFTVTNVPSSRAYAFTLELTHTTGTPTFNFTGLQWPGGSAPTLTTGKVHLFTFVTDDGGSTWRGTSQINYNS